MSKAVDNLISAMQLATAIRPKVGGFPVLAEVLRQAGVKQNIWHLPSCQSIYLTTQGNIVSQSNPLLIGQVDIPLFNQEALIKAIRLDQAGQSTFPEFLQSAWDAGVVNYVVDLEKRIVSYYGVLGEKYMEEYSVVEIKQ